MKKTLSFLLLMLSESAQAHSGHGVEYTTGTFVLLVFILLVVAMIYRKR